MHRVHGALQAGLSSPSWTGPSCSHTMGLRVWRRVMCVLRHDASVGRPARASIQSLALLALNWVRARLAAPGMACAEQSSRRMAAPIGRLASRAGRSLHQQALGAVLGGLWESVAQWVAAGRVAEGMWPLARKVVGAAGISMYPTRITRYPPRNRRAPPLHRLS